MRKLTNRASVPPTLVVVSQPMKTISIRELYVLSIICQIKSQKFPSTTFPSMSMLLMVPFLINVCPLFQNKLKLIFIILFITLKSTCSLYGRFCWTLLGLLSWCHFFQSSHFNSVVDRASIVDFIYGCPIFKWFAEICYIRGYQDGSSQQRLLGEMLYWTNSSICFHVLTSLIHSLVHNIPHQQPTEITVFNLRQFCSIFSFWSI